MLPFASQKCRLTSRYAYRIHPITGVRQFHGGVDLVGINTDQGIGTEVIAVHSGKVVRSRIVTDRNDATWQWGNYVAIAGDDGVTIYYCHLAQRNVKVGQRVNAGDCIGVEGSTGQSTGVHLHFETRRGATRINAADYLGIPNAAGTYTGTIASEPAKTPVQYEVGDKYTIKRGDVYSNGKTVPERLIGKSFTIARVAAGRILLGEIVSWVKT